MLKKYISIALVIILFASCSSSKQFASSFNKRKYTKGIFWDNTGSMPVVKSTPFKPVVVQHSIAVIQKQESNTAKPVSGSNAIQVSKKQTQVAKQEHIVNDNKAGAVVQSLFAAPINKNDPNLHKIDAPDPGRQGFYLELGGIIIFFVMSYLTNVLSFLGYLGAFAGVIVFVVGFVFCIISLTYPEDPYHWMAIAGLIVGAGLIGLVIYLLATHKG